MFIKPRRLHMVFAFSLGLAISAILLAGGYFYYRSNLGRLESEMRAQIEEETRQAFNEEYPMSLVYVLQTDKKAGEPISDTDLVPAEVNARVVPIDAVLSLEEAVGMVLRCDITQNTIVTRSLIYAEEEYPDDLRVMEYTVVNLPERLEKGEYIDVRIMFPNGLDYIILSKKRVIDCRHGENGQNSLIWLHMTEEEILRMSSAIVDASLVEGSVLYAIRYVAPDIQKDAIKTYPANLEVLELISTNPNIVNSAIETLEIRNRMNFEKRMDEELVFSGKRGVYGESGRYGPSPSDITTEQPNDQPEEELTDDLNNRL